MPQMPLLDINIKTNPIFPSTRFQGSKLKLVDWIWHSIKDLEFKTVLDAFGGTGSVAYKLKLNDKIVTYNDIQRFNYYIGKAIIENDEVKVTDDEADFILTKHRGIEYPTFIYETFKEIYFTDAENQWLDMVVTNIEALRNEYKKAIAYFALFQACIIKRPYNLFHRKNLYMRLSEVDRNFGNKATWDTPFEIHFRNFLGEANCAVYSNGHKNSALNMDALKIEEHYDLVYIDTPYISRKGTGVDYHSFYHFLEGLVGYTEWFKMIDYKSKHRSLLKRESAWNNKGEIYAAFDNLFKKYRESIIVVSYRSDGIPTIEDLKLQLRKYKTDIVEIKKKNYKYVLSNNETEEVLLISR